MRSPAVPPKKRLLDKLIFVPVVISLIGVWGFFAHTSRVERDAILEQANRQLQVAVESLADYNQLTNQASANAQEKESRSKEAVWRALLKYPTAVVWEEKDLHSPSKNPIKNSDAYVIATGIRNDFVLYAALSKQDILSDWKRTSWQRGIILGALSIAFLVLTHFLARALRQRFIAEQEMQSVNLQLEQELVQRKLAQEALHEHDALLNIVTQSAWKLLGTKDHKDTIDKVFELIGQTLKVSRIHLSALSSEKNSFYCEWKAEAFASLSAKKTSHEIEVFLTTNAAIIPAELTEAKNFYIENIPQEWKAYFNNAQILSILIIPIFTSDYLWGHLTFIHAANLKRSWTWAEMDTLQTLGGLIGVAIIQADYVKELANANRRAGMSEIATDILHNVGNVLNSINVSANLVISKIEKSKLSDLGRALTLAKEIGLGESPQDDIRAKQVVIYLYKIYELLVSTQASIVSELKALIQSIEHIREIVARQQTYTGIVAVKETVDVNELIDDSLRMSLDLVNEDHIQVIKEYGEIPKVILDKHKVLQIIINLLTNAKHALNGIPSGSKSITIHSCINKDFIVISITDNGSGIPAENLDKIFNYGFTTKATGHGFGLHNGALSANEIGGALIANSDGIGKGATFTLKLPLRLLSSPK